MTDPRKLLFVDDDASVRQAVEMLLKTMGYEVVSKGSAAEAIEAVEANSGEFGWAIVDVCMPVMDGIECVRELRKVCVDLPVVFATGYIDYAIPEDLMDQGRTTVVRKPYRASEIKALLESFR